MMQLMGRLNKKLVNNLDITALSHVKIKLEMARKHDDSEQSAW